MHLLFFRYPLANQFTFASTMRPYPPHLTGITTGLMPGVTHAAGMQYTRVFDVFDVFYVFDVFDVFDGHHGGSDAGRRPRRRHAIHPCV